MSDFEKFRIKGIDYNVADAEARANKVSRCSEFPEITAENDGEIVQFVGETTEQYTNGYFYKANLSENTWEPCPVQEADSLPESEAYSLFGTNDNNEAVAYKAGEGIILENPVLPDGYTEVEYIESDWANEAHVEEISTDRITVSCSANSPYIACFDQATSFVGAGQEIVSIKFEGVDFNGFVNWKMHCYTPDGVDHIWYEHESNSGLHNYWLIDVQGDRQVGDYFILERTGWDLRQYIDTGVVLDTILSYDWDKTNGRSYNYAGVDVEINPTAEFDEYMRNGGYIKFKAQNDGMNDNFAYGINGSYTSVASAGWIKEHYGIDITGDIVYASYDAEEAVHTVIWLNKSTAYPRYIIHTNAYVEDTTNTYLKVLGANNGNNSGIFCNLTGISNYYGWKTMYISYASLGLPVYKGWNDITIDNATTQSYHWQNAIVNGNSSLQSFTSCYNASNILLFTANFSGSVATSASLKMKRTTIQKDGVIVFDGVPAIRNSDGVAGMYDVANNVFKTSESTADFVAGPVAVYPTISVEEETEIKNDIDDEVEVVKGFENDEYVQLTWLKSNGSQVIDLGISGAANHEYEICFKCDGLGSSTTGNTRPLFGIYSTTLSQTPGYALKLLNNKLYRVFATGGVGVEQEVCGWDDDWHVVRTKKSYTSIDGVETRNISSSDNYIDSSWGLFGVKTGSPDNWSFPSPYSYFVGKISYFRDYCSGILVREFVPVRRKSDGQLGFYCIQEDRFCPNAITGYQEGFQGGEIFGTRVIKKNTSDILPGESIYNTIQKQRVNTYGDLAYGYQTSYGSNARPDGPYTTVIGANSSAISSNGRNTVVGANAETGSYYNTLVGAYTIAQGANSTVVGYASRTDGSCSVVVGNCRGRDNSSTYTTGNYSVSVGYGIGARGSTQSVFIGNSISLSNLSSGYVTWAVCIGDNAQMGANYGIAIGAQANIHAGAVNSVAIGSNAHAYSIHSVAIGNSANVNYSSNYSTAIGYHATVESNYGIQLGYGYNNETASLYVGFGTDYGNYKLLGSTGVIPYQRLTTSTAVDGYCLKYDANSDSLVWGEAGGGSIEPATDETLGGIIVGSGLSITEEGVLSADAQPLQPATANSLGGVKVGNGLSVANDGTLSADVQSNNFEDIGGDPYDNQALSDALNGLQNNIDGVQDNLDTVESGLQSQIDSLSSIGQFLAIWDCDTGIARYLDNGYTYTSGNYFIIGSIAPEDPELSYVSQSSSATFTLDTQHGATTFQNTMSSEFTDPETNDYTFEITAVGSDISDTSIVWTEDTSVPLFLDNIGIDSFTGNLQVGDTITLHFVSTINYMPDGSEYPGKAVTAEEVKISDMWFYDGEHWIYLANHERGIAVDHDLDPTSINPVENATVTAALEDKVEKSSDPSVIYGTDENGDQTTYQAGTGIIISDGKISTKSDSVGVPQIANIYVKQLNRKNNIEEHNEKYDYLLGYTDILFNLNLTKDQILEKADDLYVGLLRYKRNRVSEIKIGTPEINITTESPNISDLTISNISDLENYYGFSASDDFSMNWYYDSGIPGWKDDRGNEFSSLSDVGISYTGEPETDDTIYFSITQPEEISNRDRPSFKLMNDKYVPIDAKMYCFRYESNEVDLDTGELYSVIDPRHWKYFYIPEDASTWSYQDWNDIDPSLYTFMGTYTMSNYAKCLNALASNYTFSDLGEDTVPMRYSDGDIERFVMVAKNNFEYDWLSLRRCRLYDDNGTRVYAWCEDWDDNSQYVYLTQDPSVIPDHYTGTLQADDTVENFVDGKTFVERRDDLNYWHFIEDEGEDYTFTSLVDYLINNTITSGEWYPQDHPTWSCYWLDYPVQPVLLRDCEVMAQKSYIYHDAALVRPGDFVKLKDVIKNGWESILVDGQPVQFRYPMNTAELWLRFSCWQKRCLYKEGPRTHYNPDTEEEEEIYITSGWKNSLKECFGIWNTDGTPDIFRRRAFGRQRGSYSASSNMGKVSEYVQFNLYTPANISMGTQTTSTPVKKKLTITVASGDTFIRD